MSSYFSNTEYHLEHRREYISGFHNNIQSGNRSALGTSVNFNLYNSEAFTSEASLSGTDWEKALQMTSDISGGIFDSNNAKTGNGVRNSFDNKFATGLLQEVTSRTFSEFDNNLSNSLRDSRNSLKYLTGEAYRVDPSEGKGYASQVVFENIFGSVLKKQDLYMNKSTSRENYYQDQSYEYSSAFVVPSNVVTKDLLEMRGQETLDRLVYSDLFGVGLVPVGQADVPFNSNERTALNNRFNRRGRGAGNTITDLDFVRSKSMTNELVRGNVSRAKRITIATDTAINSSYKNKATSIISDMKYQTRPGILPFVAMIESADKFITIDTFQFQNKSISDVLASKLYREIVGGANVNEDFKVNMMVGTPVPGDTDGTSAAIFGPNILEIRKMQMMQEMIIKEVKFKLKGQGKDQDEINRVVDKINSNFVIKAMGPAHHRKVYITDQVAVLGSINLTSPVGDSVFKAGSNFEFMMMFHKNSQLLKDREDYRKYKKTGNIDGENTNTLGPSRSLYLNYQHKQKRLNSENDTNYKRTLSALMYEQVSAAQEQQYKTRSDQANVKYATDIMYTLKATVDLLHAETGRNNGSINDITSSFTSDLNMRMVLDQSYLLHVNHLDTNGDKDSRFDRDNDLSKETGEMGKFSKSTMAGNAFRSRQDLRYDMYRDIQRKTFTLIALGITKVAIDPNNLKSGVIEPTWNYLNDRLEKIGNTSGIPNRFMSEYGGSISKFVQGVTRSDQNFGQKIEAINTALGIDSRTDKKNLTAYQILAITSGNITGATVPRQHAKAFTAYRKTGTGEDAKYFNLVSYSGSANLSMSNMGVDVNTKYVDSNGNDPFVTDEMGVVFINRDAFNRASADSSDNDFKANIAALNLGLNNISDYSMLAEEENYENKQLSKTIAMSYNQLMYGNRIESGILPSIEGLPYWARQVDTGNLMKLESTLKDMSKGLGDAMSISRKYDRFGTPLSLEVTINPSGILGLKTNSSRLTYTITMLQGDGNQPGPVFFAGKEGKLIYNSNFTNNTGVDMEWKYGDKPGKLKNKESAEMSSIDNTTSIFATMITELSYRQAVSNPASKLVGVTEEGRLSLLLDFTTSVLGISRNFIRDTTDGTYVDGLSYSKFLFEGGKHKRLAAELDSRFSTIGIEYLDNTRALTGVDVFERNKAVGGISELIEGIRSASSAQDVYNNLGGISKLLGSAGYEDLALDVLKINGGYNAEGDLNKQMRDLSTSILDPYLQAHQVVSYGAGVAASKYINYGLNQGNSRAIQMLGFADRSTNGLLQTLQYARTFARDVSVYSSFGSDYEGNERFYIGGVAEGVSTQNKDGYQLLSMGVRNKFPTDRNKVDILEGVGIGTLISKEKLANSGKDKDGNGAFFTDDNVLEIMKELGVKPDEKGMLFNLDPNKPAQINQRIKNALGSRLMYEVNEEVANLVKNGNNLNGFRKEQQVDVSSKIESLVALLGDNDQAKKFINNYLTKEEVNLATMYDTDVRTVLNESAYNYVVEQRRELFDQFKDVQGGLSEDQSNVLNYLFRLKMINYSSNPNTIGPVVGGRRDRPQFVILQLNGGYSDYFYTNPNFRTSYYASVSTTTNTGIKASMLDARTFVGSMSIDGTMAAKDGFVINEGDMFVYNRDLNKVVQMVDDGAGGLKEGSTYVGGNGSSDYLIGQIENFNFLGRPVSSVKQRSTSNRPGEDSVQLILTAKRKEGANPSNNTIDFEVSTFNMMQVGSGRRQEGTAASILFKGIAAAIESGQFSRVFEGFKRATTQEGTMTVLDKTKTADYNSVGVSSVKGMNVQLSDVYGLVNPNNLKSGFFVGHGAGLLTADGEIGGVKGKMADLLVKQNNKILAAALVSQFGLDIVSPTKFGKDDAGAIGLGLNEAVKAYKQSAISGEYGTYIRMLEMQRMMKDNIDPTKGKISLSNRSADNIFGAIPQFILDDKALVTAISDALLDKSGDGNSGNLSDLLGRYVDRVKNNESGGYIINSSDIYTRGVTAVLTALDMFGQLKNQKGDVSVVTDWLLQTKQLNKRGTNTNDSLVEIAAIIGGESNAFGMSAKEKDDLAERMTIFLQHNYGVFLQLNILPSASKDPLGKNLRAKTELQHLLNPLEAQTKQFRSGGDKKNLAYVLGTVFAANETGLISLGMADSKAYLDSIDSVKALDISTLSGFFGHRFLGIYYNANSNSKDLILKYKKIYSLKIRQGFEVDNHSTYFNDGTMTMAEAKHVDNKKGYKGKDSYVSKLSKVGQSLVEELKQEAIQYNLEESKGMGTDITQPKLDVLREMGSRTFNILLPEVIGDQRIVEMTGDVNIVFSNEQSRYLFMPGAELLNQVGSSFGDFVSDIVGKSINMYSYFTPGTAENDMMIKLMSIKQAQGSTARVFNANLSKEEAVMLSKLYTLGDELLQSIIEASSDTLMQKATAGHGTEFDGYVSTPIANLALNYNMNVMPEFVNERYGAPEGIAKLRKDLFDVTADALTQYTNAGDHLNRHINAYKKGSDVQKFAKSLGTVLDYQKQMLVRGMSNVAALELKGSIETLDRVHNAVSNIQKNIGDVSEQKKFVAEALANAETSFRKVESNLEVTGAYDQAYVASYIVANMQFAKLKIGPKANQVVGAVNDYMAQTWMDKNGEERSLQRAVYLGNNHEIRDFIHNSTEKNKYSMGLDLVNFYGKQLEGAIRGKHSIYSSPRNSIRDLIDNTIATSSEGFKGGQQVVIDMIDSRINNLKDFIDNFAPTAKDFNNEKSTQEHFIAKANRKSVYKMIEDMENIKSQVQAYTGNDKGFLHYSLTELGYIHNRLSQLDNMQNQSWRSAPFGSTESHLGTLMAVRGVAQFNEMMDNVTSDNNIVRFDTVKGKSLSMFSGLSFLTSNLGDFDGDNYITLMHKITEKIDSIDQRQFAIKNYETQLANPLYLSSAESYETMQKALEKEKRKLNEDGLALRDLRIDVNKSGVQGKMAKDVAAYMGIDSRFFLGSGDDKGFRSQGTIAIASMAAMLEQGRGLYSGMQGVSSDLNNSVNDMMNINLGSINASGPTFDRATINRMIDHIKDTSNAAKFATSLGMVNDLNGMDASVQEEFKLILADAMNQAFDMSLNQSKVINDQGGEATTQAFFTNLVTQYRAISKGNDALAKVTNAGHGIAMGESTYDVLTKTLGKAGSDVLGKTYNTLLGTFVADSPIVSLYHMLDSNSSQIAENMNKAVAANDPSNTDAGTRFMANLQAGYDRAQQLQGWNKAVQQMLRDSIKLKGDSKSVMEELTRVSGEYATADEARRIEIIDFMASKIGPGAGMKGLMDLNKMIHNSGQDKGGYGKAEDYNLVDGELEIAKTMTGYDKNNSISDDALIKYKVANSLRSITTMFNFEKNFGEFKVNKDGSLAIDDKSGSNRALEKAISEGLHGFLGKGSDSRATTLLLAEHATGSREMAAQLTENLYSSIDAINGMTSTKKLIHNGSTRYVGGVINTEQRDILIADEMNKFALAITTADEKSSGYKGADSSSGIFGSMMRDHIGLNLDSAAAAKLNETRGGKAGLSAASLLVISHHASITQTKAFIGDHGEQLDRFVHLNDVAHKMQSKISRGLYDTGTNLLGSDLFNAAYRLMAQGKLSTDGGSVMGRLFKAVNDPNMSNADAMGKMLANYSSDAAQTSELTDMYEHLKHVEIQHDSAIPGVEGLKETVGDLIERQSKKTAQGFKLQAISEVAKALHDGGDMSSIHYKKMATKINEAYSYADDDTRGKQFIDDLLAENGALLGNLTQEGKDYFKPKTVHRGSDGTTNDALKMNVADKGFNIIGPAILSMIGGAIYGGSKDGAGMDMAGVVGGTLTLMGYNMPGVDAKSKVAGAMFRSRAYANPDEDAATALAKAASTEVSIGLVGSYVTPKLTKFISNNVVAPLIKNNIPIAESGVSAIVGSFVGAVAMNMLNSAIQQGAGLLKNNFNAGDNNLNSQINAMEQGLSDIVAKRRDAELNPFEHDEFLAVVDKLDMPSLVVGVWATDAEKDSLRSDNSMQLSNGEEGYV